jgi:DNA replicative helicase MCM subunit Mcm2 (Cdc46/Mcm family)
MNHAKRDLILYDGEDSLRVTLTRKQSHKLIEWFARRSDASEEPWDLPDNTDDKDKEETLSVKRDRVIVLDAIHELSKRSPGDYEKKGLLLQEAEERGVEPEQTEEVLDTLKQRGDIYMPKRDGFRVV